MLSAPPELPDNALDRIDPKKFRLLELMALAVAEQGGPLSYDELQARLARAGVVKQLAQLKRAWHGHPPLRKTLDSRLALDPSGAQWGSQWERIVAKVRHHLGLDAKPTLVAPPPEPPDDRTPLAESELQELARLAGRRALTDLRWAALMVEVKGPMTLERLEQELQALWGKGHVATLADSVANRSPFRRQADGLIALEQGHPSLLRGRSQARSRLARFHRERKTDQQIEEEVRAWIAESNEQADGTRRWYEQARKAVLHCFFQNEDLVAASVLDPDTREFTDCGTVEELRRLLREAELLIGLDLWDDLERLRFDPGPRRVVDLKPPIKNRTINKLGRPLAVTPADVIQMTLGASRPLGDPDELASHHEQGHRWKLLRRLRSDTKALWAFYDYGARHGYVRLVFGVISDRYSVDWNVGHLPSIDGELRYAAQRGDELEVVIHSAPGWKNPWSRARRAVAQASGFGYQVVVEGPREELVVDAEEVFAVRVVRRGALAPILQFPIR